MKIFKRMTQIFKKEKFLICLKVLAVKFINLSIYIIIKLEQMLFSLIKKIVVVDTLVSLC